MRKRITDLFVFTGAAVIAAAVVVPAQGQVIVDDDFSDGDLAKTGALDTNWWTSSSSSGIEIAPGVLGHVTGTSGRGIHTVFPTQTLANVGDKLVATYTFTTPATVGFGSSSFRVGLFDTLGRAGLDANVSASSSSPNVLYGCNIAVDADCPSNEPGLPGYMLDHDVNNGADDLNFREHNTGSATGRLMATTGGGSFSSFSSGPDNAYLIVANTQYTGSFMIERISATEVELTGMFDGATHSQTDTFDSVDFGFLGFHANSNQFGSTNSQGQPDNGLDFSRVTIEFIPVPEPSTAVLALAGGLVMLKRRK